MTEAEIRREYASTAMDYLGTKQGSSKHREIVDIYNSYLPHPRGYALTVTAPWCAAFDSAIAILCDMTDIIPVECSCGEQIKLWQRIGRWEEDDAYRPGTGDLLYYDWGDDGKGDDTDAPDHVGIVVSVSDDTISVVEGNKGDSHIVGLRHVPVNGRYVRGYGLPDFAQKAEEPIPCTVEVQVLQYRATGEAVRALQALLNLRGRYGLKTDGSFGPATLKAVKAFQQYAQISVDGSVGPVTWGRLING